MIGLVQSMNEGTWGIVDMSYTFFVLAASFLGIIINFYKDDVITSRILNVTIGAHIAALFSLVLGLQHPLRVLNIYTSGAGSSWTYIGSFFILFYLIFLIIAFFSKERKKFFPLFGIFGILIVLYLGKEFGELKGIEIYQHLIHYVVLIASGLVAALGMCACASDKAIDSRIYNLSHIALIGSVSVMFGASNLYMIDGSSFFTSNVFAILLLLGAIAVATKDILRNWSSILAGLVGVYAMFIGGVSMPKSNFSFRIGEDSHLLISGVLTIIGIFALMVCITMFANYLSSERKAS